MLVCAKADCRNQARRTMAVLQAEYSDGGLFAVGPEHGFLPKCSPLQSLPERYAALDELLQRLPVWTDFAKGEHGILANKGDIVQHVHDLPDYTDQVRSTHHSLHV